MLTLKKKGERKKKKPGVRGETTKSKPKRRKENEARRTDGRHRGEVAAV